MVLSGLKASRSRVAVLVDTSALYALADAASRQHQAIRTYVSATREVFVVPVTVFPEIDYLVTSRLGVRVELALLSSVAAGDFRLESLSSADLERSIALIEQYADGQIGLVDASIVAIAERLNARRILTLDRRHFLMFRPRHCAAFELVP